MHLLARIVKSVGEGSPFLAINARRLRSMAWFALGFQAIGIPVGLLQARIDAMAGDPNSFDVDISGFILALVLFVLARVFERGAAMQDDLEATV